MADIEAAAAADADLFFNDVAGAFLPDDGARDRADRNALAAAVALGVDIRLGPHLYKVDETF